MKARQVGVSMRQSMELTTEPMIIDIITEAYSAPAYNTQKNQDRAIQDFEDLWYLKCVKAYNE